MLKQHWRIVSKTARIADNAIIIGAFSAAYFLRDELLQFVNRVAVPFPQPLPTLGDLDDYFVVLAIALPLYNIVLTLLGAYRSMRWRSIVRIARNVSVSSGVVFLCVAALLFILKIDLSRSFIGIFCALSGVCILIERVAVLNILRYFRARGKNFRNVLIVGTGEQAREMQLEIERMPELGVRVAGFVDLMLDAPQPAPMRMRMHGAAQVEAIEHLPVRVVANADTFEAALKKFHIDEVLFTDVMLHYAAVQQLVQIALEEGISVAFAADLFSLGIINSDISYFGATPLIHYDPTPTNESALLVKRALDIVVSATGLVVLSPALLLLALLIKLESPGDVFFRQKRVGLNGRKFTMLKFRSMVNNAESMLESLRKKNEMQGPVFKMKDDPRVTKLGSFIRRFSIDELPQLINVLRGDMSLVGPRPALPSEVKEYERAHRRRLSMRPGITCIWQVSGRNNIPNFEDWTKLDFEYIDNWSLLGDLKLLLKTIPAVLFGSGAR